MDDAAVSHSPRKPARAAPPRRVLIVEDDADVAQALRLLLVSDDYQADIAASPDEAAARIESAQYAAAIVDMNYRRDTTSGGEGLQLIARLRAAAPQLPVLAMTAWASVGLAVEAMRVGAADFIEKPWSNVRLLQVLATQIALHRSHLNEQRLSAAQTLLLAHDGEFVAESPSMRAAVESLRRIAGTDANVLLLGENGTGKTLIAQKLHEWSPRAARAFVKVNVGALAPGVFESELFGHVRGAYTDAKSERAGRFELADGGSLFLDEIGTVPAAQQAALLRVVEDGEFERVGSSRTQRADVRLIAATNLDLAQEVRESRFRQDLLYRLNTFEITLPPLRERDADIVPLARLYLAQAAARYRREPPVLTAAAERALLRYPWPGNVRELAHAMERAALLARGAQLDAAELQLRGGIADGDEPDWSRTTLEQAEARLIRQALERHGGNLQRAADQLGITRQSLYRRLEKHGLSAPEER
ncbi:sigma-54 dependent transcriptional regulator [Lysobacter yananisis]|uniref:Sigma-54 dependent transcriptional regulator n=1 Tax=Lysobacter yananisis TaxID=1003114 RepID=A0ABY9PEN5_9GAMM|nr:sigma-54 dependent transcriptional regulator [Lysobacter yananisis]WMT05525.1 sigma-54 dependent transcriptional regulator [Lysobacter yananisis]